MSKQVISMELTEQGIAKAIAEVEQYKKEIQAKENLLRAKVAEFLRVEAQNGFNGAVVDDVIGEPRIASVTVTANTTGNPAIVIADGQDAVWVEFGAGVHYNGAVGSSPNPYGSKLGFTIGSFGKGNGARETWGYFEEGELRLTRGTLAKMPMANAITALCNEFPKLAREVFG